MAGITPATGLATGIDTSKIMEGLLAINQRQIQLIQGKQQKFTDQLTAFKSIQARLMTLQGVASKLGRTQNNVFQNKVVTSSDETIATAASAVLIGYGLLAVVVPETLPTVM